MWNAATGRYSDTLLAAAFASAPAASRDERPAVPGVHIRLNQAGYLPSDTKVAVVFSQEPVGGSFIVVEAETGRKVLGAKPRRSAPARWGPAAHHFEVDLTPLRRPGRYLLRHGGTRSGSPPFTVGPEAYRALPDQLLEFLRQQRCGYNPFLDTVCHPFDGRTAYGPMPDGTYLDSRGGWHDAGDQLKYLLTASNATAQLLLAYRLEPGAFGDAVDALGRPGPNGLADVLDEARWGLEWMLRLHPEPEQLFHQVADDRDHIGWELPQQDDADYGWGRGRYRVVYFADGRPQGLGRYESASTGVANLAGRYAAAMALAYQIFRGDPRHQAFAERCLRAGLEVYRMGREKEGVQQGNSYGAPYRYAEQTWADDMEWGAAELHRATREAAYLEDALRYARRIGATSWMGLDAAEHYEFYPFMNLGHFSLHPLVDEASRAELAAHYREGLERTLRRAEDNPYRFGVPFIWCSNNLVVALVTQGLLYERMTGDGRYRPFIAAHRDWLLGRNPWGVSMFTGLPEPGLHPRYPHLSTTQLMGRSVRGGLVDGPVAARIFGSLKGVALSRPDPFARFQSDLAVYHDDVADYATNEPTMDGTASAVLMMALLGGRGPEAQGH